VNREVNTVLKHEPCPPELKLVFMPGVCIFETQAIVALAAEPRKLAFRYRGRCGMSADTGYVVRSAIPTGFDSLRSVNRKSQAYKLIMVSVKN
jgi:hypothetical protein